MDINDKVSKKQLIIETISGKFSSIAGWLIVCIFVLVILVTFDESTAGSTSDRMVCIFFVTLGIIFIIAGKKIKNRIKRCKRYIDIIGDKDKMNVSDIASIISKQEDFVLRDLQKMITRKYFQQAYIDEDSWEIIFGEYDDEIIEEDNDDDEKDQDDYDSDGMQVVICSSCGAKNKIRKSSTGECEYCGSAISGE